MKKLILFLAVMATVSMMFSCTSKKTSKSDVSSDSTRVDSLTTNTDSLSADSGGVTAMPFK